MIIITRADEVLEMLAQREDIVSVLSIEHPGAEENSKGFAPRIAHLPQEILSFYDTEDPEALCGPTEEEVRRGLVFALEYVPKGTVLIHCHAGKSRSVAMGLGVLAAVSPEKEAHVLLEELIHIRDIASPNRRMVQLLDHLLGRQGALVEALDRHPEITERRARNHEARLLWGKRNPEHLRAMYPGRDV